MENSRKNRTTTDDVMHSCFDVVIVGAGIAGCAAAIALRRQLPNLSILLLERNDPTPQAFRIGETLPPQTMPLLQQLGLSKIFLARGDMEALGTRSIWGEAQVTENPFLYSCYGHGWHIDRTSFDNWMMSQSEHAGAVIYHGATIVGTPKYRNGWHLAVKRNTESMIIETPVVIDASGRRAVFCRNLGVRINKCDKLVGIFRFFQHDDDSKPISNDSFTLVESSDIGWWYSACLPQGRWIAALMTDSDHVRDLDVLNETGWRNTLAHTHHTRKRFLETVPITPPRVTPAHSQYLEYFCGPGWYAIGDAATTFDPLSSLGIFKALRHGLLVSYAIYDDILGKPDAQQKYQYVLDSEFKQYQQTHRQYYQLEQRYSCAAFWQRRQTTSETAIV